jgi:hypothetical protein
VPETGHGARIDGDASGRSADGLHSMQRKSRGKRIGSIEVIGVDGFSKETETGSHAINFALDLDLLVVCHHHRHTTPHKVFVSRPNVNDHLKHAWHFDLLDCGERENDVCVSQQHLGASVIPSVNLHGSLEKSPLTPGRPAGAQKEGKLRLIADTVSNFRSARCAVLLTGVPSLFS